MGTHRISQGGSTRPTGSYSTLAIAPAGDSLTWISGQVGRAEDGTLAGEMRQQTLVAFRNLEKAIRGIGLDPLAIVHLRAYVVERSALDDFTLTRDEVMTDWFGDGPAPASTLLIVSGMADPHAQVEIEAVVSGNAIIAG